ncbi:MAG: hypothetical protein K2Y16_04510 [Burkholderiales bacterium]|nr:hypothetical protein [Burkholderiales bacterium]
MSQQINLLNPALVKKRLLLSATTAAGCVAVTLAMLIAFQFYSLQQIRRLEAELQSAQAELKAKQSQVQKLGEDSAARKKDDALDAEIARLETELKIGRENMQALKGGALGNQQGFAEYLRAFSRQSVSGLWLTGFTIAGAGDISIQGRVTHADLVPSYIQRLNQEKILQGRTFAALEMHTPKGASKDQKKLPRFLEFTLTTAEPASVVAGAGKTP